MNGVQEGGGGVVKNMLRHIFPCRLLWRSSTDRLKNGVTIYNNQIRSNVKYMCFHSASFNHNNEENPMSSTSQSAREIPIKFDVRDEEGTHTRGEEASYRDRTTYSEEEVNKFRNLSQQWWEPKGECMALHSLNKLRVALVRDGLMQSGLTDPSNSKGPYPLRGLKILDIGCGGGILCEPLARLGAEVTGVDAAEENIAAAQIHAQKDKRVSANVKYIHGTIEEHAQNLPYQYDAVIASEVLEHVHSVDYFVETCSSIIKPGGSFFITTINKTTRSWLGAIIVGEYVLGILPRGTHEWDKFVPDQDLRLLLQKYSCNPTLIHGMAYIPFRNEWFWVPDSSINYAVHAVKQG